MWIVFNKYNGQRNKYIRGSSYHGFYSIELILLSKNDQHHDKAAHSFDKPLEGDQGKIRPEKAYCAKHKIYNKPGVISYKICPEYFPFQYCEDAN